MPHGLLDPRLQKFAEGANLEASGVTLKLSIVENISGPQSCHMGTIVANPCSCGRQSSKFSCGCCQHALGLLLRSFTGLLKRCLAQIWKFSNGFRVTWNLLSHAWRFAGDFQNPLGMSLGFRRGSQHQAASALERMSGNPPQVST